MRLLLCGFTAALALLTTAARALAFDGPGDTQAMPCRPTIACTAELASPGAFELEVGGIYRRFADDLGQASFPFLAKLTVASFLQLQLGSNGYTYEHGPGAVDYFDNLDLGAKFHLVDQATVVPAVALSFTASVPSAEQAGYPEHDSLLMTAYVSKDIGPLHVDVNVGLNRLGVNGDPVTQEWQSIVLSTSLPAHLGVAVENYYFTPAEPIATHDGGTLFALSYNPVRWLVLDAGADIGYFATRAFSVFGGMTVIPFVLFRPS
jgi:hypothetical protein